MTPPYRRWPVGLSRVPGMIEVMRLGIWGARSRRTPGACRWGCAFKVGIVLVLVIFPGCADHEAPSCPASSFGVVEGYVLAGGQPAQTQVSIEDRRGKGWGQPGREFHTQTDSTGWYALEAPVGPCILEVGEFAIEASYGRDGAHPRWETPDTLLLTGGGFRVDFALGSLLVEVAAPPAFEGRSLSLDLYRLDDRAREVSWRFETVSGGRALFEFPLLFPFQYCLKWGPEYHERAWLPGTWDPDAAAVISVGADAPTTYETSITEPWYLEGSITGSWQVLRLDPPKLTAFAEDSSVVAEGATSSDGTYKLEVLLPEPVRLWVDISGMTRWLGGSDFDSAALYVGSPGEIVSAGSYIESGIECRFERDDFSWWPDPDLSLYNAAGSRVTPEHFRPERDNPAPIPGLDPGVYFLQIQPRSEWDPWLPQWYDHADSLGRATPIEVFPGGSVTRITAHLETGGRTIGPGPREVPIVCSPGSPGPLRLSPDRSTAGGVPCAD